jgi:hypothetical protein
VSSPEHHGATMSDCVLQGLQEAAFTTPCSLTTSRKRLSRGSSQQQQGLAHVPPHTSGVPAADGVGEEYKSPSRAPAGAAAAASRASEQQGGCSHEEQDPGSSEPGSGGKSSAATGAQQSNGSPGSGRGRFQAGAVEQPSSSEVLLVPSQQLQYGQEPFARPGGGSSGGRCRRGSGGAMEVDTEERRRGSLSARGTGDRSSADPLHTPEETTPEGKGTAPGLNFSTPYPLLYRHHSQGDANDAAAAVAAGPAAEPRESSQGGGSPDDPGGLAAAFRQADAGGLGHGGVSPQAQLLDVLEASAANLNQGAERLEFSAGGILGAGGLGRHDSGRSGCTGCVSDGPGGGLMIRERLSGANAPSNRQRLAAAAAVNSGAGAAAGPCPQSKEAEDAAGGGEQAGGDWADMLVGDQSGSRSQEGDEEAAPHAKSGSSNALNEQSLGTAGPYNSSSRPDKSIRQPSLSLEQHIADLVPEDMSNLLLTCCLGGSAALAASTSSSGHAAATCAGSHQPSSNGGRLPGEGRQTQQEQQQKEQQQGNQQQQQEGAFLTPQKGQPVGPASKSERQSPGER